MNTYKLRYFVVVAEEMNISQAAHRLFISQQALSSQISQLEEHYGIPLFVRKPRLLLTDAGRILYEKAKQFIELEDEIEEKMASLSNKEKRTLKIGVSYARGRFVATRILHKYHSAYPDVELRMIEGDSAELCDHLERQSVDLIIDFAPIGVKNVVTVDLANEPIYAVIPEGILAGIKDFDEKNISDILRLPLLLLTKGNFVRNVVDRLLEKYGIAPNVAMESKNIDTLFSLGSQGMGVTICSATYASNIASNATLRIVPLDDPLASGQLVIAHLPNRGSVSLIREFIAFATSSYA